MKRYAVVTGGAQGIGAAAAAVFLADGGAGVLLVDRNTEQLAATAAKLGRSGAVETIALDLRDDDAAVRVFARTNTVFGHADVLVNAAGNTERCGITDTTAESYRRLFDVNVKAPLFMMQEAVKGMVARKSGVIVNISSMLAHGGPPNLTTYSSSKAALVTMSKSAANEFKRQGVRVYCINLGWVNTEGEHITQTQFHKLPEDWASSVGKRMPTGRLITAVDVAKLIAFLVSPAAAMMNGVVIDYEQMPVGTFDTHPALATE